MVREVFEVVAPLVGWPVFAAIVVVIGRFLIWKAKQETTDTQLLRLFVSRQAGCMWQGLTGLVLFLLLALSSSVGHFGATNEVRDMQRAFAIGTVVVVALWVGFIARHGIRYWHNLKEYTRTGQLPSRAGGGLLPETTG